MKDYQRSKVYDWEDMNIRPYDKSRVAFQDIQGIVDYVWSEEGLLYPPQIKPLPKNVKRFCGRANRTTIQFHENQTTPTCVILHELAHSLTSNHYGEREVSDLHGSKFVGMLIYLLEKYMNFSSCVLMYTARQCKVDYEWTTQAVFVD